MAQTIVIVKVKDVADYYWEILTDVASQKSVVFQIKYPNLKYDKISVYNYN